MRGLIEGADVNLKNYYGERALSHAASKGYAEIFELLIRSGADTNADKLYCFTTQHRMGMLKL